MCGCVFVRIHVGTSDCVCVRLRVECFSFAFVCVGLICACMRLLKCVRECLLVCFGVVVVHGGQDNEADNAMIKENSYNCLFLLGRAY